MDNSYANDFDVEEPVEESVRRRQKLKIAAYVLGQAQLFEDKGKGAEAGT